MYADPETLTIRQHVSACIGQAAKCMKFSNSAYFKATIISGH